MVLQSEGASLRRVRPRSSVDGAQPPVRPGRDYSRQSLGGDMHSGSPEPATAESSRHAGIGGMPARRLPTLDRPAAWVGTFRLAAQMLRYRVASYFLSHLTPLKLLFAVLRRLRPIAVIGNTVILTKAHDVREVLERFDDFPLGEVIEPGMPWGSFLMTIDWPEQHKRERALLESAAKPAQDLARLKQMVVETSGRVIAGCAPKGTIDVVSELAEPVVVEMARTYFGIPPVGGHSGEMAAIMGNLAGIIMVNPPVGSKTWAASRDGMFALSNHIDGLIAAKHAAIRDGAPAADDHDLLSRLVRKRAISMRSPDHPPWFTDDWIRRYLMGLVATGGATIVRAIAHTVDQLVGRDDAVRQAARLAPALDRDKEAHEQFRQIVYEALRLRPMLPLLLRGCPRDTTIALREKRARCIYAGSRVLASPLAAMFDRSKFRSPWRFRSTRPLKDYLHFGDGQRTCFGRYIADVVLAEVVRALVVLPGLKRASGRKGRVGYEGPVPCRLVLTFKPWQVQP
jgi:cytochrome P450